MKEQMFLVAVKNVGILKRFCYNEINNMFSLTKSQKCVIIGQPIFFEFHINIIIKTFLLICIKFISYCWCYFCFEHDIITTAFTLATNYYQHIFCSWISLWVLLQLLTPKLPAISIISCQNIQFYQARVLDLNHISSLDTPLKGHVNISIEILAPLSELRSLKICLNFRFTPTEEIKGICIKEYPLLCNSLK